MSIKRTVLAAAVAAATLPAAVSANDVDVYGRLNLTLQATDVAGESETKVASHSSRFGVKGSHEISAGLEAFYQAEWGLSVTGSDPFSNRNQFIGLRGDFGSTTIGRRDTALKLSQGKVDQFNDFDGDLGKVMGGEVRASQQVSYATPTIAGMFKGEVTYLTENGNGENGFSVAAMAGDANYKAQPFYAAIGYDSEVSDRDILRVTAGGKLAGVELGFMFSDEEVVSSGASGDAILVSAAYGLGNTKLKAQFVDGDVPGKANTSYSVGAEHKLSSAMRLNAYYTGLEFDGADDDSYFAVGVRYDF
ncbi:porin [Ferrimonas marina]|uniref:Outer membrane protein (Porin) n=1 Tax=Ferrimonas marina TaxID=299255 RepID=A0A1M5SAK1_9GAMM|nr:porin [Ferrimonas marina]SHH35526.1 Outer membrane protein (porin) [Ferrimonas marina]